MALNCREVTRADFGQSAIQHYFQFTKPSNLRRTLLLKGDFQRNVSACKCISVSENFTSLLARPIFQGKLGVRAFRGMKNNTSNLKSSKTFSSEKREKESLTFEVILCYCNPLFFRQTHSRCRLFTLSSHTYTKLLIILHLEGNQSESLCKTVRDFPVDCSR
jgi:hypothetical protein